MAASEVDSVSPAGRNFPAKINRKRWLDTGVWIEIELAVIERNLSKQAYENALVIAV
jgi:hypothetical protein